MVYIFRLLHPPHQMDLNRTEGRCAAFGGNGGGHTGHRHSHLLGARSRRRLYPLLRRTFGRRPRPGDGTTGDGRGPSGRPPCSELEDGVEHFRWEKTAKETYEVYRSAVLQPSARSLSMRRRLREAILSWSEPLAEPQETGNLVSYHPVVVSEPLGVRTAWNALNSAVQRRIRREISGFILSHSEDLPEPCPLEFNSRVRPLRPERSLVVC